MSHHDKHLYHFEKYLRQEMTDDERLAFDEKLSADPELKQAFVYYKAHRAKLLKELIAEHEESRKDNRFNKLIFLLISLTGIALAFNYVLYLNKEEDKTVDSTPPKNIFVRYIPFLNWDNRNEKIDSSKTSLKKDSTLKPVLTTPAPETEPIETIEPAIKDEERSITDIFLNDTFITIYDKSYIDQLLGWKQYCTDSVSGDTSLTVVQQPIKPKGKNSPLFVEFWQSPVGYKGYLFTGKKLIVYGVEAPFDIYIYRDNNETNALINSSSIPLIPKSNFQPF
ncbi:MAG: hypothetical protein V4590_08280 [Bacteroidota bacterium]